MIRLPLNRANELVQIEKARKVVVNNRTEESELKEIAGLLNMTQDHVRDIVNISREMVSLDTPLSMDRDSSSVGDFLEDDQYEQPEDMVIESNLREDIDMILGSLSDKEAEVIRYRFGLNGYKAMSLNQGTHPPDRKEGDQAPAAPEPHGPPRSLRSVKPETFI